MGQKGSRFVWSGREADRKDFLPVRKSPFTNTAKSLLFCSPKVNISLYLMESLQNWELLGKNCINSGLYWGSEAGNYYDILGGFVVAWRRGLVQRHKLYACPAGGYFSVIKSRQKNFI